jgi:hypothetical protein
MKNGNHNRTDGHGAELVEYIYDEMETSRRDLFEQHLADCDRCSMELAAISDARLGVMEWRSSDFDPLATPAIEIPFDGSERQAFGPRASGLADIVRSIFQIPMTARIAAGLATAAVVVGIVYYGGSGSWSTPEVTEVPKAPQVDAVNTTGMAADPTVDVASAEQRREDSEAVPGPDQAVSTERQRRSLNRNISEPARRTPVQRRRSVEPDTRIAKRQRSPVDVDGPKAPSLSNFDETEDTTLRLAELFEEVGSS